MKKYEIQRVQSLELIKNNPYKKNSTQSHRLSTNIKKLLTSLLYQHGVPDWNRTNGLVLRRHSLYPTELRGQIDKFYLIKFIKNNIYIFVTYFHLNFIKYFLENS